jgi:hypothetical protein
MGCCGDAVDRGAGGDVGCLERVSGRSSRTSPQEERHDRQAPILPILLARARRESAARKGKRKADPS